MRTDPLPGPGLHLGSAASGNDLRVGLLGDGFVNWTGGIDFLRLVASSLRHAAPRMELHVLAPARGPRVHLRDLRDRSRSLFRRPTFARRPQLGHVERAFADIGATLHLIDAGPRALDRTVRRLQLDATLPAIAPPLSGETPWVGYLFDFQHKHLPHFFSRSECATRDTQFRRMLDLAEAVVVNSKDVVNDINHYYPSRRARVFAMPFSPAPASDAFMVDIRHAWQRYDVQSPYFIVCNQFWKHKDHGTAFEAFSAIAQRHPELSLVCTGETSDYRFPGYFDHLMQQATRSGVSSRIRTLGLIPKPDQLALMRGAVALLQPTLFEGGPGGGAVYDAVALGQRSIVSDIVVNTEIDEHTVTFFKAGDAGSLAAKMQAALAGISPPPDPAQLIARGIERRRACGQVLLEAVKHVMQVSQGRNGCR